MPDSIIDQSNNGLLMAGNASNFFPYSGNGSEFFHGGAPAKRHGNAQVQGATSVNRNIDAATHLMRAGETTSQNETFSSQLHGAIPTTRHNEALPITQIVNTLAGSVHTATSSSQSTDRVVTTSQSIDRIVNPLHGAMPAMRNVEALRCSSDDIFIHVPQSLRQQIGRGEYINLALLLKGGMELAEFCSGGSMKVSTDGSIEMKSKICKEKIPSIEKWTDAFLIYASIYISAYPTKASEILHYMYLIREAAARQKGYAWRAYDEQFRIRQAAFPSSWAAINNDLWWRCMQMKESEPANMLSPQAITRTCNDFNKGFCRWPSCKYSHTCSGCGALHGAWSCPNKPQTSEAYQSQPNASSFRG